jgi:hypothetical protein
MDDTGRDAATRPDESPSGPLALSEMGALVQFFKVLLEWDDHQRILTGLDRITEGAHGDARNERIKTSGPLRAGLEQGPRT